MDLQLQNKVVIVTGATGAIGTGICQAFLKEDALVIPFYRGQISKLELLYQWMKENDIGTEKVFPVEVDLESVDSMRSGVDSVLESFDRIDILINNAGWTLEKPFLILTDEEWDRMISINLTSVARLSRLVMKGMLERKQGAIVNISSTVASAFGRGVSAYASAKAAVNRLTEVLALEMGKKGLRVNTVCPGVIDTPMSEGMIHRLDQHIRERTPMRRIGTVDEVAPAVLFLASEATASFITGQHIYVNGGVNIGL
jgi:3-oxoacyl-[acyl-carrier protein] reductase